MLTAAGEKVRTGPLRSQFAGSPRVLEIVGWVSKRHSAHKRISAGQLGVEAGKPPFLFPAAEPPATCRICTASRRLHRQYCMRASGAPLEASPPMADLQLNVKTLAGREKGSPTGAISVTRYDYCDRGTDTKRR